VKCKCGHELSGFKILDSQGRFEPGIPPNPDEVRKLLPRLKCNVCGVKGKARLILNQVSSYHPLNFSRQRTRQIKFSIGQRVAGLKM
jgi:hypothetical protein